MERFIYLPLTKAILLPPTSLYCLPGTRLIANLSSRGEENMLGQSGNEVERESEGQGPCCEGDVRDRHGKRERNRGQAGLDTKPC
ncbi:hypothetical protein E2C01_064990 [Portunus trituberculatus]|uniref:Uncharacterized protein n=1 Tax=Portunus trituberculatus TaxID=210409 RepID=A0A5B7HQI8_PORTR|nr:hypothetical protein [Portunus trituberculatus]